LRECGRAAGVITANFKVEGKRGAVARHSRGAKSPGRGLCDSFVVLIVVLVAHAGGAAAAALGGVRWNARRHSHPLSRGEHW
jgi:hypothetical protein